MHGGAAARSQPSRPFSVTGFYFAGPFIRKERNRQKPTQINAYVCMYVCFSTKAILFDPVMDVSTEAFLESLRRFSAIYGMPQEIHSDNGSIFVGANRELKNIYELWKKDDTQSHLHHCLPYGISAGLSPLAELHISEVFGSLQSD